MDRHLTLAHGRCRVHLQFGHHQAGPPSLTACSSACSGGTSSRAAIADAHHVKAGADCQCVCATLFRGDVNQLGNGERAELHAVSDGAPA